MGLLAHIGKVPVEEWLPFVVPVLALFLWGRRKDRARREALRALPDVRAGLDRGTVAAVLARWERGEHARLSAAHLPLLYPPGPDERSAGELAERLSEDRGSIEGRLRELERLGYLELEEHDGFDGPCAALTAKGYDLLDETEAALVEARATARAERTPA